MKKITFLLSLVLCLNAYAAEPLKVLLLTNHSDLFHANRDQSSLFVEEFEKRVNSEVVVVGRDKNELMTFLRRADFAADYDLIVLQTAISGRDGGSKTVEQNLIDQAVKYGKPILDRVIKPSVSIGDASRCALISMDSTLKSDLTVGPPIDFAVYKKDEYKISSQKCLNINDNDYAQVCNQWSKGILKIFDEFPRFDWEK